MKVAGVVQARMGSSRLPGKVMSDISGRPMVICVADRLRRANLVDEVAIATSDAPSDDVLVAIARAHGLRAARGPVDDIALRLLTAARELDADYIVRVWGDCPLLDPAVVDALVDACVKGRYIYASNGMRGRRTYPVGLDAEVYRRDALERIAAADGDPRYREFPVEFVLANFDESSFVALQISADLSALHWTVDYPEDLETVRRIYDVLGDSRDRAGLKELLVLLEQRPELFAGFSHASRNVEYKAFVEQIVR